MKIVCKLPEGSEYRVVRTNDTRVYDDSGQPIGYVQKIKWEASVEDPVPKCTIEVVNANIEVDVDEDCVEVTKFGPRMRRYDEMTTEGRRQALYWEAKQRYLQAQKIKDLEKQLAEANSE
jgi:hypothetical protein